MKKYLLTILSLFILTFINTQIVHASACEYSLASIESYSVSQSGGSASVTNNRNNPRTTVSTDTKLTMSISDTYVAGQQNISWSLSDSSYTLDNPTSYNASTSSSQTIESGYENEQLAYYQTCPSLRILFVNESGSYHIKNIVFSTGSGSTRNSDAQTLLAIFNGSVPSGLKMGEVDEYNIISNSSYMSNNVTLTGSNNGTIVSSEPAPTNNVNNADDEQDFEFCDSQGVLRAFDILHKAISIARIFIPIILIAVASIALFKAMIESDEKAINKATHDIIVSLIISVVAFFIPTLIYSAVNLVDKSDDEFNACTICFTGKNGDCSAYINTAKNR